MSTEGCLVTSDSLPTSRHCWLVTSGYLVDKFGSSEEWFHSRISLEFSDRNHFNGWYGNEVEENRGGIGEKNVISNLLKCEMAV